MNRKVAHGSDRLSNINRYIIFSNIISYVHTEVFQTGDGAQLTPYTNVDILQWLWCDLTTAFLTSTSRYTTGSSSYC